MNARNHGGSSMKMLRGQNDFMISSKRSNGNPYRDQIMNHSLDLEHRSLERQNKVQNIMENRTKVLEDKHQHLKGMIIK